MSKILQARLQQYMKQELTDVQAGFGKGRGTKNQIANICWIIEKARELQKSIYFCFTDYAKTFDCVDHDILWKILKEMGIPVRECLTGGFLHAVSASPLFLFKQNSTLLPGTEVIVRDRLESPLVNILFMTKLLSLHPLSWDMGCLLTLWPLLIPCSLGNGCCTFGFLIFIIIEKNLLYNSLYTLTERSLKHLCSIRAWVPMSFFLYLSLANSLERRNLLCSLSCLGF